MKHNKFIIYEDNIILGRVRYHVDLLPQNFNRALVHGGGIFELDKEQKNITFSGYSFEFGQFNKDLIKTCKLPELLEEYIIIF